MVVNENQLIKAEAYFNTEDESKLEPFAIQMNRKHKVIPIVIKELERKGLSGDIVDELMLSILVIWYTIEITNHKRIEIITENDVQNNVYLFKSMIHYFNGADEDEKEYIQFVQYEKDILTYAVKTLYKININHKDIPKEVITIYMSIVKSFEDKLKYTRE
jgi:hypothetical protein